MNSLILTILFTIISIIFLYIAIKAKKNYIQILWHHKEEDMTTMMIVDK